MKLSLKEPTQRSNSDFNQLLIARAGNNLRLVEVIRQLDRADTDHGILSRVGPPCDILVFWTGVKV